MLLALSGLPVDLQLSLAPWPNETYEASAEKHPLINLPHLTLPSGEIIAQSGAILRYVATKCPAVKPADDLAFARCEEAIEHFQDLQKEWIRLTYGADYEQTKASFLKESVPYFFGNLNKQMELKGYTFVAGNSLTIADLVLTENVERLIAMAGSTDSIKDMTKILAVYKYVKAMPELQETFASVADYAFNGPEAHWAPMSI